MSDGCRTRMEKEKAAQAQQWVPKQPIVSQAATAGSEGAVVDGQIPTPNEGEAQCVSDPIEPVREVCVVASEQGREKGAGGPPILPH